MWVSRPSRGRVAPSQGSVHHAGMPTNWVSPVTKNAHGTGQVSKDGFGIADAHTGERPKTSQRPAWCRGAAARQSTPSKTGGSGPVAATGQRDEQLSIGQGSPESEGDPATRTFGYQSLGDARAATWSGWLSGCADSAADSTITPRPVAVSRPFRAGDARAQQRQPQRQEGQDQPACTESTIPWTPR